jgi:hypothetical protein
MLWNSPAGTPSLARFGGLIPDNVIFNLLGSSGQNQLNLNNGDPTATVNGHNTYTTPTGFTLPTTCLVAGTDQWQAYWLGQLQDGASREQVIDGILSSQEALSDAIESYYQAYLGRAPEPTELQFYLNQLLAGGPGQEEAVAMQIIGSQQFFNDKLGA